jgi:hypothetical protein
MQWVVWWAGMKMQLNWNGMVGGWVGTVISLDGENGVRKGMKYNDSQPYFVIQEGGGRKSKPVIKRAMKRLGRKKELRLYKLRDAGDFVVEITMGNGSDEMRWMSRGG